MDIDDLLEAKEQQDKLYNLLSVEMDKYTTPELREKLLDIFATKKNGIEWMYSKSFGLGGKRPYDFCRDGNEEIIMRELGNIEYGNLA